MVDVAYFTGITANRLSREKKKEPEKEDNVMAESLTKPEVKGKAKSKEITFGTGKPVFYSPTTDFPTLSEAVKMKPAPPKPVAKKEEKPAPMPSYGAAEMVPQFINTKKREAGPTFVKLEEQKPAIHTAELISEPYTEKPSREFEVNSVYNSIQLDRRRGKRKVDRPAFL